MTGMSMVPPFASDGPSLSTNDNSPLVCCHEGRALERTLFPPLSGSRQGLGDVSVSSLSHPLFEGGREAGVVLIISVICVSLIPLHKSVYVYHRVLRQALTRYP